MSQLVSTGQITIVDWNDVTIASSAPVTPVLNQLWFDTSITPPALKRWDGSQWISANITPTEYQNIISTINGTTNYRLTGPPTNDPTPTGVAYTQNEDGSVDIVVSWNTYVQGIRQADSICVVWKKGNAPLGKPTLNDNVEVTNVNTSGPSFYTLAGVNPADNYSFGILASRRTDNGIEYGNIVSVDAVNPVFTRSTTANKIDNTSVASGLPRYETGKYGQALTIEEGTTNLFVSPKMDVTTGWSGSHSSAISVIPATGHPFGSVNCIRNTPAVGQTAGFTTQTVTLPLNTMHTVSFWVYIPSSVPANSASIAAWYVNGGWQTITSTIIPERDTWVLKSLTFTSNATYGQTVIGVGVSGSISGTYFLASHGQLEQKPYNTSFIAGTRANEVLSVPGSIVNAAAGSIDCWVYMNGVGTNHMHLITTTTNYVSNGFYLWVNGTLLQFIIGTASTGIGINHPTAFTAKTWHHVAITWDGTSASVYLNGVPSSSNGAFVPTFPSNLYIGSAQNTRFLNGYIEDFRISNRKLTDAEVLALYTSGSAAKISSSTIALLPFDGTLNQTIDMQDVNAGNPNFTGLLNGVDAAIVVDGAGRANSGLTVNGDIQRVISGAKIIGTPTESGLHMTKDYLGYYDQPYGLWRVYIDKTGKFKFGDGINGPGLAWDPTADNGNGVLAIRGTLEARDIKSGGTMYGVHISGGDMVIGSDDSAFRADDKGIYLGNTIFASAPFSVTPLGLVKASNINITGGTISIGSNYSVTNAGVLTCTGADITGKITATTGYIGNGSSGWTIGNTSIHNGRTGLTSGDSGVYIGTDGIALGDTVATPEFKVTKSGALVANNATLTGSLNATSISTSSGNFSVDNNGLISCTGASINSKIDKGLTFNVTGTCQVLSSTSVKKTSGANGWGTASVYSSESYYNGAYLKFTAVPGSEVIFGLNSDPTTDQNYLTIDYSFKVASNGNVYIYESGSTNAINYAPSGGYTSSTLFEIKHDGQNVTYSVNGNVVKTTAAVNKTLYLDSSFFNLGEIDNIKFCGNYPGTITSGHIVLGDGTTYGKLETYNFDNASIGIQLVDGTSPAINMKSGYITGATLKDIQFTGTPTIGGSDPIAAASGISAAVKNMPEVICRKEIRTNYSVSNKQYTTPTLTPAYNTGQEIESITIQKQSATELTVSGCIYMAYNTLSTSNYAYLFVYQGTTCIGVAYTSNTSAPLHFEFDCFATGGTDRFSFQVASNQTGAVIVNPTTMSFGGSGAEKQKSYIQVAYNPFTSGSSSSASFLSDGTWTAPAGVTSVTVTICGGGGGGGGYMYYNGPANLWFYGGSGGGGGSSAFGDVIAAAGGNGGPGSKNQLNADAASCKGANAAATWKYLNVPVTPGNTYPIKIGKGGGAANSVSYGTGGAGYDNGLNGTPGQTWALGYNTGSGGTGGTDKSAAIKINTTITDNIYNSRGLGGSQSANGTDGYVLIEW